jgi:hypothetical protein
MPESWKRAAGPGDNNVLKNCPGAACVRKNTLARQLLLSV